MDWMKMVPPWVDPANLRASGAAGDTGSPEPWDVPADWSEVDFALFRRPRKGFSQTRRPLYVNGSKRYATTTQGPPWHWLWPRASEEMRRDMILGSRDLFASGWGYDPQVHPFRDRTEWRNWRDESLQKLADGDESNPLAGRTELALGRWFPDEDGGGTELPGERSIEDRLGEIVARLDDLEEAVFDHD